MSATLPTCSGVFFRLHCRHQQVFEKEYKRSNRNRGTKILRCFPHCCPSHVERSYCGSSLELAVEFPEPLPVDAHSLFVFARFETVDLETTLAVGEMCSLRQLQNVSQSETNPEAVWIQGAFQSRAATATTSVFLLNGQTSSKWYYHWESGANKARRLTKHLLKAYIVYRRGTHHSDATADRVQVIGTVSSPPFTLVSYRRAAWEGLEGMDDAAYAADGDAGNDYDLHQVVQDQISQAFQGFQKQSNGPEPTSQRGSPSDELKHRVRASLDHDPRPRDSLESTKDGRVGAVDLDGAAQEEDCACDNCAHYRRARPPTASAIVRDQWTWERQHMAMTLHMKDIALIYYFVSNAPMALAMQSYRVREYVCTALQHDWASDTQMQTPSGSKMRSRPSTASLRQPAILLSLLFPSQDGAFTASASSSSRLGTGNSSPSVAMNSQLENLLLVVTKLSISLLTSETFGLFQGFFDHHASVLLRKRSLRDAFLHFAGMLCKRIHLFWSREVKAATHDGAAPRDSAFKALRTMSEHIIALSHSHSHFQAMWPDLREILEAPGTIMWASFIAQLRETYLRKQIQQTNGLRRRRPQEAAHRYTKKFSGSWGVDASTVSTERASSIGSQPPGTRAFETPSISGTLLTMVQLQHVHIRIPSKDILLIRSDSSLLPSANPWMQLVCDGSTRTTSAFPLGLSSLIGSQLLGGDYVASMDPTRSRIHIDLFWWPLHVAKASASHAVRVGLTLHLLATASDIQVTLALQHGTLTRNAATRERLARIDLCSPTERAALGVDWAPQWKAHAGFTRITE